MIELSSIHRSVENIGGSSLRSANERRIDRSADPHSLSAVQHAVKERERVMEDRRRSAVDVVGDETLGEDQSWLLASPISE